MASGLNVCSHFIRNYRTQSTNVRYNAGIQKRLRLFKENHPDLENADINEGKLENLENGEIDIQSYNEKKGDKTNIRIIDYKKIERKFFKKNKLPNLLSWSEKEQIKFLNNSDPIKWSPEKLSESFPVLPEIIKKLIKTQWKPLSSDRIILHDNSVSENWKAIENGILKLPGPVAAHVKKFISRKRVASLTVPDKSLEKTCDASEVSSEFLGIIKSYKNKSFVPNSSKNACSSVDADLKRNNQSETFILNFQNDSAVKKKYYTLQQLKRELRMPEGSTNEDANNTLKESETNVNCGLINSDYPVMLSDNKSMKKENFILNSEHNEIPLTIRIPKEKAAKSKLHVYKVSNCYYDYQGNFLYMVPGMS